MPRDRLDGSDGYDVAILGSGIGGTILGAILARSGLRVLLLEQGCHPRFAIGESTSPEAGLLLRILARRYAVPEIEHLASFQGVRAHVSAACGVKRNFSFVHHRAGEPWRPEESTQFLTLAPPFGPDIHYFRQDVDAYMLSVAAGYGAEVRQQTQLADVSIDPKGVQLTLGGGERVMTRYVVDAGGVQSPLGRAFGLRETPCPLRTRSRTLYTHMIGVAPLDACGPSRAEHGLKSPLSQGTLHHFFEGGWIWIIPFSNHPASTNRLCSVGLTLDLDRYPYSGERPDAEFQRIISRYPTVRRQLEQARPVRPFIAGDRLQFSSSRLVGDRFCLLPHAATFVDPLFSSGLVVTLAMLNALAHRIIDAARDDDFDAARFSYVDTWAKRAFSYYDRLVACSYTAFSSFALWNAWHRVWMLGSLYGANALMTVLGDFAQRGDQAIFESLEAWPYRGVQAIDLPAYMHLFDAAATEVEATRDGRGAESAVASIYRLLRDSELAPAPWALCDPNNRCPAHSFTLVPMLRLVAWGRYFSPDFVRTHYFTTGRANRLVLESLRTGRRELGRLAAVAGGVLRDTLWSWNEDFRR